MCTSDLVPGVPDVVQLHHPGEDGAMAVSAGVDRHLLHNHSGTGESQTGEAETHLSPILKFVTHM